MTSDTICHYFIGLVANQQDCNHIPPKKMPDKKQNTENLKAFIGQRLPQPYSTLINLYYFEELSYDEISKQLDIPLSRVKSQMFRARDLLINILQRR